MNSRVQDVIVQIKRSKDHRASSDPAVVEFISVLIQMTASTTVLEIGTLLGYATIHIAASLPTNGVIYTIDIHKKCVPYFNKLPASIKRKIVFVQNDSKIFLRRNTLPAIDIAFIDGDHSFRGSFADVVGALCHLKANGYLILHDALHPNCPGVHATIRIIRFINLLTLGNLFDVMTFPTPPGEGLNISSVNAVISGVAVVHLKHSYPLFRKFIHSILSC